MEEAKITSIEKVKDPKKVEAGKRLAAVSKQAKEKKASQKMSVDEFQTPSINSINPLAVLGVVGVVGFVVYYKYFSKSKPEDLGDRSEAREPNETKVDSPKEVQKQKPKRRELDTLD